MATYPHRYWQLPSWPYVGQCGTRRRHRCRQSYPWQLWRCLGRFDSSFASKLKSQLGQPGQHLFYGRQWVQPLILDQQVYIQPKSILVLELFQLFLQKFLMKNTRYMNRADPILDHRRFHRAYRPFCTAWVVVWQVACQIGFDQECTVVPGGSRLRRRPWHPSQYRSVRCLDSQRVRRDRRHRGEDFQRELSHYPRKLNQFRMHGGSICPRNLCKAVKK